MALRRWKPFLGAFALIDAAIEAAADADGILLCRDEFRGARSRIVELLCDAAGDGERAEALCALLDDAMAESLATLRAVPADKNCLLLASGDLVGAVGALMREHASERVRELARDVVRAWRAGVKAEVARATAVLDGLPSTPPPPPPPQHDTKLDKDAMKIPEEQPRPRKATLVVTSHRVSGTVESKKRARPVVSSSNAKAAANMEAPAPVAARPKKTASIAVRSVSDEEKKVEATKRRLHGRYQEAEDAKRRRTIQVIKPPRRPSASCAVERRASSNLARSG